MRSSDAWLGWPYDVFNFSMVAWALCLQLHEMGVKDVLGGTIKPGTLFLTAGSQHLYATNVEQAKGALKDGQFQDPKVPLPSFNDFVQRGPAVGTLCDTFVQGLWISAGIAAKP
jgi:thymidylate synthase